MSEQTRDVGSLLKQERESKGIALDVVHETTKIPLDALKAIEEGYKVRTLTAFYYKSFVKLYANYLGLDANFIVTLIPTHHPKPLPAAFVRPPKVSGAVAHRVEGVRTYSLNLFAGPILKKKKKAFKAVIMVVVFLVAALLVGLFVRKIMTGIAVDRAMNKAASPALKPVTPAVKKSASVTAAVKPPVKKAEPLKAPAASVPVAVNKPVVKEPAHNTAAVPKRVSMTVRAQTTTWISVIVDGEKVFQGSLKKGTASSWNAVKKIELSAKDTTALEFEVNGRNVGKISRRDLKARKVVVTAEGLNVEK